MVGNPAYEAFIAELEALGEAEVRNRLAQNAYAERRLRWAQEWLSSLERARNDAATASQLAAAESQAASAREQAREMREANTIARRANTIAIIALLIAIAAAAISTVSIFQRVGAH